MALCTSQFQVPTSPPGAPGVLHLLSARVPGFVPSELPGGCPRVGPIIKVPSRQLMPHEGTFQLQTDLPSIAALLLQNLFQSWGKALKLKSVVLKLKLEGMTKE